MARNACALLAACLVGVATAQFSPKGGEYDTYDSYETMDFRRRTPPVPGVCPAAVNCIMELERHGENLMKELDAKALEAVDETRNPMMILSAPNLVPTMCKLATKFEKCMELCDEDESEMYDIIKPAIDYLCVETVDEWGKHAACLGNAVRDPNDVQQCMGTCGIRDGRPDRMLRELQERVEVSPSFKTIFGRDGVMDQICTLAQCMIDCAIAVVDKSCTNGEAGELIRGLIKASLTGSGNKLIEYELTGLASPKCRELAGMNGDYSLASIQKAATSFLTTTVILAVLLIVAVIAIVYLVMTRRRGNFH